MPGAGAWHQTATDHLSDEAREATLSVLRQNIGLIAELAEELWHDLECEDAAESVLDRMSTQYCIAQAEYHLGRMTLDELLERILALTQFRENYSALEQFAARFIINACHLGCATIRAWTAR